MLRRKALPTIILLCVLFFSANGDASDISYNQVTKILMFYEILSKETPSVKQFFQVFGETNEAELELILRQDFPYLDLKGKWFNDRKAKKYIDDVYKHPDHYTSKFLTCIRLINPLLFAEKRSRLVEFPPLLNKDFKRYSVWTDKEKVIFEFSQDEDTIENIYLSTGESIYDLVSKCEGKKEK